MGCFGFCKGDDSVTVADRGPFMQSTPTGNLLFPVFFRSLKFFVLQLHLIFNFIQVIVVI